MIIRKWDDRLPYLLICVVTADLCHVTSCGMGCVRET